MSENNELEVVKTPSGQLSDTVLAQQLGDKYGVPSKSIINLLRDQIIAVPKGEPAATPAELAVVMSVMRQYNLNPMLKQIHGWRDNRGRLAVMVGYDGWVEYARKQSTYQGVSYRFGPIVKSPDGKGHQCWEWVQAVVHDSHAGPIETVPVYLEEWYVPQRGQYAEPWQKQTKHRLHLKAFTSAIREVYGLGGVVDEVDKDIMQEQYHRTQYATADRAQAMVSELSGVAPGAIEFVNGSRLDILPDDGSGPLVGSGPFAVDESDMIPPARAPQIKVPCDFCSRAGYFTRCGECGRYACPDHMSVNGFQCGECFAKGGE